MRSENTMDLHDLMVLIDAKFRALHKEQGKAAQTANGESNIDQAYLGSGGHRLAKRIKKILQEFIKEHELDANQLDREMSIVVAQLIAASLYKYPLKQLDINDIYGPGRKNGFYGVDTVYHYAYASQWQRNPAVTPDYADNKEAIIKDIRAILNAPTGPRNYTLGQCLDSTAAYLTRLDLKYKTPVGPNNTVASTSAPAPAPGTTHNATLAAQVPERSSNGPKKDGSSV